MKNKINNVMKVFYISMSLMTVIQVEASNTTQLNKIDILKTVYSTSIMAERITKSYLYIGNKIGVRQAKKELDASLKAFQNDFNLLNESTGDPKSKNLLLFMQMSFDELQSLTAEKYTIDNAQIALDLSATISEGARFIAKDIKKSINLTSDTGLGTTIIYLESIAKYYMAYQAGIKDDNTIKLMKDIVNSASTSIDRFQKDSRNSVEMNRIMNRVQRLWNVVYRFYLDMDQGGLPFIVFKTTDDLTKSISLYNKEMFDIIKKNLK